MFLQIDGTFILQIVNFFVFYMILRVVFIQPVGRALAERRAYINSVTADYQRAMQQVKDSRAKAESVRAAARRQGAETFAQARNEARSEADTLAAAYAERAATLIDQAHATVEGEMAAARAAEDELARQLAASLLDRAIATAGSRA